jgi:hypothetical protein
VLWGFFANYDSALACRFRDGAKLLPPNEWSVSNLSMNENQQLKPNWNAVLLPVCSVAAIAWMLVSYARIGRDILLYMGMGWFAVLLSPFVLLSGALLLRWRPRIGYMVAAVGAALPLPWIFMTESRAFGNSWIAMNASSPEPDVYMPDVYMRYSQLRIVSVALLLMTLIWAMTRLLPSDWQLRNRPVNQRTWPSIIIALILVVCWFAAFALPYREPLIVDAMLPELSILNVKKDGIAFHETRVSVYRDGRYYVIRNDRKLFRYSFGENAHEGLLTDDLRAKLNVVQALPELKRTLDKSPRALRTRHGEGWYTEMESPAITAFTTENATFPPAELVDFFRAAEGAPSTGANSHYEVRDVCLGFCYDPKAGLGYTAENQRCAIGVDGKEHCY